MVALSLVRRAKSRLAAGVAGSGTSAAVWQIGDIQVELRRSARRRTLGLQVKEGRATAHAPASMSETKIRAFLELKRDWLTRHVRSQQATSAVQRGVHLGDSWQFLGETLLLQGDSAATKPYRLAGALYLPPENWQKHLQVWVSREVLPLYTELVTSYAEQLGARARLGKVRVSATRSRWGSCTASGDIRLHWALSRAPLEVLRYVALHEAAHLLELNHSPRYWAHVKRIMPEHANYRAWLRRNGRELLLEE